MIAVDKTTRVYIKCIKNSSPQQLNKKRLQVTEQISKENDVRAKITTMNTEFDQLFDTTISSLTS